MFWAELGNILGSRVWENGARVLHCPLNGEQWFCRDSNMGGDVRPPFSFFETLEGSCSRSSLLHVLHTLAGLVYLSMFRAELETFLGSRVWLKWCHVLERRK